MFISTYHVQNSLRIYGSQMTASPQAPSQAGKKITRRTREGQNLLDGNLGEPESLLELSFEGTEQVTVDLD